MPQLVWRVALRLRRESPQQRSHQQPGQPRSRPFLMRRLSPRPCEFQRKQAGILLIKSRTRAPSRSVLPELLAGNQDSISRCCVSKSSVAHLSHWLVQLVVASLHCLLRFAGFASRKCGVTTPRERVSQYQVVLPSCHRSLCYWQNAACVTMFSAACRSIQLSTTRPCQCLLLLMTSLPCLMAILLTYVRSQMMGRKCACSWREQSTMRQRLYCSTTLS
mmetsp:Transcript_104806/g.263966  ORF Transcript_104806/g.263966 Transcript_104806/m.263966 type:complete len:219 (-) Transcript_104806:3944-4600(-)